MKCKTIILLVGGGEKEKGKEKKFGGSGTRQRDLRLNPKSMIHKRNNW